MTPKGIYYFVLHGGYCGGRYVLVYGTNWLDARIRFKKIFTHIKPFQKVPKFKQFSSRQKYFGTNCKLLKWPYIPKLRGE